MLYYIDGNNVQGQDDVMIPGDQSSTIELTSLVVDWAEQRQHNVILVFDGVVHNFQGHPSPRVTVRRPSSGSTLHTADDVIIANLHTEQHRDSIVLVSDDKQLIREVRAMGVTNIRSSQGFADELRAFDENEHEDQNDKPSDDTSIDTQAWLSYFGNPNNREP